MGCPDRPVHLEAGTDKSTNELRQLTEGGPGRAHISIRPSCSYMRRVIPWNFVAIAFGKNLNVQVINKYSFVLSKVTDRGICNIKSFDHDYHSASCYLGFDAV